MSEKESALYVTLSHSTRMSASGESGFSAANLPVSGDSDFSVLEVPV